MSAPESGRDPLEVLFSQFVQQARQGLPINIEDFAQANPEQAEEIRELFPTLLALEQAGHHAPTSSESASVPEFALQDDRRRLREYRLLREIGAGGMGVVYEAVHEQTERKAAIKVLPQVYSHDTIRRQRFLQEARTVARLSFRNIVPIYDVYDGEGRCFFAMRLIEGVGLDWVIQRLQSNPQPLTATEALAQFRSQGIPLAEIDDDDLDDSLASDFNTILIEAAAIAGAGPRRNEHWQLRRDSWKQFARIGIQAAKALQHAHDSGILHRDIKPANLLIDEAGVAWVTDFGLAKSEKELSLTGSNDVVGTLRYIAPERYEGKLDARSDIYSLGLTLLELCVQRNAFSRSSRSELIRDIMTGNIIKPRECNPALPEALERILLKAAAKNPEDRYASANELVLDLKAFAKGEQVTSPATTIPEKLIPRPPSALRKAFERVVLWRLLAVALFVVCLAQQITLMNRPFFYTPHAQDMLIRENLRQAIQQRITALDTMYEHVLGRDVHSDLVNIERLAPVPRYGSQQLPLDQLRLLYQQALREASMLELPREQQLLNQRMRLLNRLQPGM